MSFTTYTPYFGENGLFKPTENTSIKEKKMKTINDQLINLMNSVFAPNLPIDKATKEKFDNSGCFTINTNPGAMPKYMFRMIPGMQVKFPGIKKVKFSLKTTDFQRDLNAEPETIMVKGQKKVIYPYAKDENGKKIPVQIEPILATIVYFDDNTKTVVQNSKNDKVVLEDVKLSDGTTIKTASDQSKELAVVYAIVKRLFGKIDKYGNVIDTGLSRRLTEIVSNGYDTTVAAAESDIAETARKTAAKAAKKPAKKHYSIAETLARFNAILDKAEAGDPTAKSIVNGVMA